MFSLLFALTAFAANCSPYPTTGTIFTSAPAGVKCYELPADFEDLSDLDLVDTQHSEPIIETQCGMEDVIIPAPVSDASAGPKTVKQEVCHQVQTGTHDWVSEDLAINATRKAARKAALKAAADADTADKSAVAAIKAKLDAGTTPTAAEQRKIFQFILKRMGQ